MRTDYVVTVVDHNTQEVLTILDVREEGARGRDGKPENVALLCRPPMLRAKPAPLPPSVQEAVAGLLEAGQALAISARTLYPRDARPLDECDQWVTATGRYFKASTEAGTPAPAAAFSSDPYATIQDFINDTPRRRRILEREKALQREPNERGPKHVTKMDGSLRLYSLAFRPEGGFIVEPVDTPAPDTEIEMDRRQAERADFVRNASADEMTARARWPEAHAQLRGSVTREPKWREPGSGGLVAINWQWRDGLLDRLRDVLTFPGTTNNIAVVREAVSFLKSLAP